MNGRKKIIYGVIASITVCLFGFCTYSAKDLVVYAGQRDKDLTKNETKIKVLELTVEEMKEFQNKQNEINNEIDKKLSSIQTILKALADKEGIRYD